MKFVFRVALLVPLLPATGCNISQSLERAARNITLKTPEPIKVDMKITLDVYQHDKAGTTKPVEKESDQIADVRSRKYNRQAEIQRLKDSRLIAETHQGLLHLRDVPAGQYGGYVEDTVNKENADRKAIMIDDARKRQVELHDIEKERYESNVKNSFAGEWIEVPDPARPGAWKLVQKEK